DEEATVPTANLVDGESPTDVASSDEIVREENEDVAASGEIIAPEALEPWKSVSVPTYADLAGANRFAFIERIGARRLAGAGAAVLVLALLTWRLSSGKSAPEQVVAAGALAESSRTQLRETTPAVLPDSPTVAAPPPDTTRTDTAAAPTSAKLSIVALKPIRVGDSATLRARIAGDTKAQPGPISWTSSNAAVARVNSRTGRLVAVRAGTATI